MGAESLLRRIDGALTNIVSGWRTQADPRRGRIVDPLQTYHLSLGEADALMREWGCDRYVSDLPKEALRKGVRLSVDAEDEEEGGIAKHVLDLLEDLDVDAHVEQALIWERQYGGALLVLLADDGRPKDAPLDLEALARRARDGQPSLRGVRPLSRYRVSEPGPGDCYTEEHAALGRGPEGEPVSVEVVGLPHRYHLLDVAGATSMHRYVHASRVIAWRGESPRERIYPYEWGESVLTDFHPVWGEYAEALANLGHALRKLGIRRHGMRGMAEALATEEGRRQLGSYAQEIATLESAYRLTIHDAEDSIEDATVQLSNAAEIVRLLREDVAGATGWTVQRFFGAQRSGMSDKDESGSERDDGNIRRYQKLKLRGAYNRIVEVALAGLGYRDVAKWQVIFPPLREETPSQRADRQSKEATTAQIYERMQAVDAAEIRGGLRADPDISYQWAPIEEDADRFEHEAEGPGEGPGEAPSGGEDRVFLGPRGGRYADPDLTIPLG